MSQPQAVDSVIAAAWIIPIIPAGRVFKDCCVVVDQGRILAICPSAEVTQRYSPRRSEDLGEQVLMPGLVNAHNHGAMSLLRGFADDMPLMQWLEKHIWPTEMQWVTETFVEQGTELACAEMLRSGTTCFSDMYFFPEASAAVAHRAGMRAQIHFPILEFPTAWGRGPDEYFHKGLALHDQYRSIERINVGFGPHAPYTVGDAALERVAILAEETQASVHIHLHETPDEISQSIKDHGVRPAERLARLGILGPLTQCVHMTQVTDDDIQLLVDSGASVIHCPESNLKLATGLCPVQRLLDAGINVGLGTDGAASNNDLDMFGELASAALLAKIVAQDAAALNAHQALHMATLGGAQAFGLEQQIGSLEAGKQADMIALTLGDINALPLYDLASHLVYNNRQVRVTHAWVAGKSVMQDRQLVYLDEQRIRANTRTWQQQIQP